SARVVVAQQVASVQVDRNSLVFDALRAEQGLIGAALDRLGNAVVGAAVAYTAEDSSVVHVDETGTVRALNNGATQVIASARGVAVPIPVVVAQRAVRVQVPQDTIRFAALAVQQAITGQALDSLGSPVAGQVTALSIADTAVIKAVDSAT